MNAPSPSSRPIQYSRRIAAPGRSAQHAPRIEMLVNNMHPAANEESATTAPPHTVNPLWMITGALGLFVAVMVLIMVS
jgi:hypothetical protein